MPVRQVYLLSPKELSPETIAVAFAKTSRSPESFREIAAGLGDAESARFHERWVVGYGHASVAEHAVLHLAIENVSRLAIECIESNRLASYTEKSTRYQKWGPEDFVLPPELEGHALRGLYERTVRLLFETYARALDPLRDQVIARAPRRPDESDEAWDRRVRSRYVDSARFLLPAAALANVGMTVNARVLEGAIRKLLAHPLAEVRAIGDEIKRTAQTEVPTLVKYAEPTPAQVETVRELEQLAAGLPPAEEGDWCILVDYDPQAEEKVLAAALYRFGGLPYAQALHHVYDLPPAGRERLAAALIGRLGRHDVPLRELEYAGYLFDLVMDQGAYFEFKRHRMMTQTPQPLTAHLGYAVPRLFVQAGLEGEYRAAMDAAAAAYEQLAAWNPRVAAYVVPNGFNRRVLAGFNLREAYHFCRLRSAANAHFSIRRVALRMAERIRAVHPLLGGGLPEESWQDVEAEHFA